MENTTMIQLKIQITIGPSAPCYRPVAMSSGKCATTILFQWGIRLKYFCVTGIDHPCQTATML